MSQLSPCGRVSGYSEIFADYHGSAYLENFFSAAKICGGVVYVSSGDGGGGGVGDVSCGRVGTGGGAGIWGGGVCGCAWFAEVVVMVSMMF